MKIYFKHISPHYACNACIRYKVPLYTPSTVTLPVECRYPARYRNWAQVGAPV